MPWTDSVIGKEQITSIFDDIPLLDNVEVHELRIGDGDALSIRFDLENNPKSPPAKWVDRECNTVKITLKLFDIDKLSISGWESMKKSTIGINILDNDQVEISLVGQAKAYCIKSSLRSTYHAIRPKYSQRYLSEFQYRFNRRFDLRQMIPRLASVALRTPPMPEILLKVSLV